MAVKKAAKKSAKKTSAKKSAKKTSAKRAVKKSVKKAPAKKSAVKKSAKKVVKKSAKKTAKKASSTFVVPAVPSISSRSSFQSPSVVERPAKTPGSSVPAGMKSSSSDATSKRVVIAVVIAVVLLAIIVVSRNGSTETQTAAPEATATAQASQEAEPTAEASSEASAEATTSTVVDQGGSEPVGIVAQYTSSGATIFWKAPTDGAAVSNYNVEIRSNGGTWKLITTVPADQYSIDITKGETTGWASFRISSVLEDGTVDGGKVFGLPGQWA
ncbi:hypothetical protein GM51_16110 [freshwater metagenome]|uniref:Fibronectin type-III domain-containing protein n=1 Tax=freshwater metagenome TaxID=449393 RepID=A0A094QKF7_9ZZZZ